jgi:hypothetical protein
VEQEFRGFLRCKAAWPAASGAFGARLAASIDSLLPTDAPEPRPERAPPRHLDFTDDQAQDAPEFDAAW